MRLSWQEIRARAALFADEWQNAHYEKGETQSFYNAFFRIFGVERRRVAVYEQSVARFGQGKGFIDLFWPGTLIVEQKSQGRDLLGARMQALDYTNHLKPYETPKYILVSDFQTFELTELDTGARTAFALSDLPRHVEKFAFILGRDVRRFKDQDPVNIKAAELVGALHDALEASGYTGHKLEVFLVRIVFCLFADDTGIFEPKDILWDLLEDLHNRGEGDFGSALNKLFDVLNTPEAERSPNLAPEYAQFPYVNGALFAEYFPAPDFNEDMRAALLNACRFDWTPISPAIFGSLFQSVMNPRERREKGAHYTTEKNILKVIEPLFLDDLRAEFERIRALKRGREARLGAFQDKLAGLTFFDPACGCGNFLVIAYRELRALEHEVLAELNPQGQWSLDLDHLSKVDVSQFYGIEYEEFPARIAEIAMWMMDHIMNNRLSALAGGLFTRIPLRSSATIRNGDSLEIDWADVLPAEQCSFVLGNPPFVGFVFRTKEQKEGFDRVLARCGVSGSRLDYVFGWFLKAAEYAQGGNLRIGFVATNSVTQGEQVAVVWPVILDQFHMVVSFAHRTFEWGSEARGKAHVHVVIIGLDKKINERSEKRLFNYATIKAEPNETTHSVLSPYLIDASGLNDPHLVIRRASEPLNGLPVVRVGTKPVDAGHYIFSAEEKEAFLVVEPKAEDLFRPFMGARE
ncbi:MAG: SAM-dependent methyltransferase, partial [Rhodobacterales bacterium CG2_30_65_12]